MLELTGKYGKDCKVFIDEVEDSALGTIYSILDDKVSEGVPVRIMPDVHDGKDIVIGFTMPVTDRVNPNHVGVDIGCGVLCIKFPKLSCDLADIDRIVRSEVRMGFEKNPIGGKLFGIMLGLRPLIKKIGQDDLLVNSQLGTLGGGNHFIEIGESSENWFLFVHSGSRNFGLQVCKYHSEKAKASGSKYLFEDAMDEYLDDMYWTQLFAKVNRSRIAIKVLRALGVTSDVGYELVCDTVHNYIDRKHRMIRKGAVSAERDEMLVIPMNMRDGVLVCKGKGNPDWNYSAPHGAGRVLSRGKAKSVLSMDEFQSTMQGVYSTSVCPSTLDESPMAYKDMQTIIDCIGSTVEVVDIVKPILNIKALD